MNRNLHLSTCGLGGSQSAQTSVTFQMEALASGSETRMLSFGVYSDLNTGMHSNIQQLIQAAELVLM